jgi:PAS domain S-box-containing protein
VFEDISEWKRAQETLRQNEERYRLLVEQAADGILVSSERGHFLDVNSSGCQMFGYSREEILGLSITDVIAEEEVPRMAEDVARFAGGKVARHEWRFRRKDGSSFPGEVVGRQMPDGRLQVILRDTTERKQVEKDLRESERLLRVVMDLVPHFIFAKDRQSRHLFVNRACAEANGRTPEQMVGLCDLDFVPDRVQAEAFMKDDREVIDSGRPKFVLEEPFTDAAGQTRILQTTKIPFAAPGTGKPALLGVSVDITELKRAEMARIENTERYRSLFENMLDGYAFCRMLYDRGTPQDFVYLDVNPAFERLTGLKDVIGKRVSEVIPGIREAKPELFEIYSRVALTGETARFETYLESLGIWFSMAVYSPAKEHFVTVFDNITERKRAELALRESEERYQALIRAGMDGFCVIDLEGRLVEVSDTYCSVFGFPREQLLTMRVSDLEGTESPEEIRAHIEQIMERGWDRFEAKHRRADGTVMDVEVSTIFLPARRVILSCFRNITARKQAEAAIQERLRLEERLSKLAAAVPGVMYAFRMGRDGDFSFPFISSSVGEVLGLRPTEIVDDAMAVFKLIHPNDVEQVNKSILESARALSPWQAEFRLQHPRKGQVRIEAHSAPECEPDGNILWHGFAHDITERVQLEAQLRQAQKMESIGQLSGGIAHDFNNILGVILGNAQLARTDVGPGHPALESLEEILKAGRRAKNLVQQILTFARQHPQEQHVIALQAVLNESVKLLRATLPAGVELVSSIAADTPDVLADSTQLQQVILNLGTNAWHALEGRPGCITLTLARLEVDTELARNHADLRPGPYARLSISDTGKGIEAAMLERIFEPFFTTKAPGQGTGLGLAVVHGIIKNHSGAVTVTSQPGVGSTFHLYLPAANAEVERADSDLPSPFNGQGQHILYLDDEADLVWLAVRMLERFGYRVSGFTRPEEALNTFRENPQQFDLVVTDYNMPIRSGLDVSAEILAIQPGMPVVLSSGYITEELRDRALRIGIRDLVYKPNTMEGLCDTIHRLISKTRKP